MNHNPVIDWNADFNRYENSIPHEIRVYDKTDFVHSWADALCEIALGFYKNNHELFKKMNARFDFEDIFARKMNFNRGTRGLPADLSNPFIVTKMTSVETLNAIHKMMAFLNVTGADLSITCERTVQAAKPDYYAPVQATNAPSSDKDEPQKPSHNIVFELPDTEIPEDKWFRTKWSERDFLSYNSMLVRKIVWDGKSYRVHTWSEAVETVFTIFASCDIQVFHAVAKMNVYRNWFAPQTPYCKMVKPAFIKGCCIWVETNHLPGEILSVFKNLLCRFSIDNSRLEIWCAQAPSASGI